VQKPVYSPAIGALVLALKGANVAIDMDIKANIERTRAIIERKK